MKSRTRGVVSVVLSIGLLAGLAYGAYVLVRGVASGLAEISPEVSAAIVAGTVTTLVSVFTVVGNQRTTRALEVAEARRASKVEVYRNLVLRGVVALLDGHRSGQSEDEALTEDPTTSFREFSADAIVWSSPEFVKAYTRFRAVEDGPERLLALDDLLRAIQSDLGVANRGLERGDLVGLFLTDRESLRVTEPTTESRGRTTE